MTTDLDERGILRTIHVSPPLKGTSRKFASGASRDTDIDKLDMEGFLSPPVLEMFAQYMHKNRHVSGGYSRASDNWQQGIPFESYMKSAWRHFFIMWKYHRGVAVSTDESLNDAMCGLLFNVMGYMHETIKVKRFPTVCCDDAADYETLDGEKDKP